jgi:hypothetical protein
VPSSNFSPFSFLIFSLQLAGYEKITIGTRR